MAQAAKAKVFTNGGSQVLAIPEEFRFSTDEVFIRRDLQSGDVIICEAPSWDEIFTALDKAGVPDDVMTDRGQDGRHERDEP